MRTRLFVPVSEKLLKDKRGERNMYKLKNENKGKKQRRHIKGRRTLALTLAAVMIIGVVPQGIGGLKAKSSRALEDHTVKGMSPQGTTINLFDYWVNERDSADYPYENNHNGGINAGHQLKFTTAGGSMNAWTGGINPRQGMVSNTLVNGYPQLSGDQSLGMTQTESLDYLFNTEDETSEPAVAGKRAFTDVEGLLQVSDDNYYYYDSKKNFASFQEDSNSFLIYDAPAVKAYSPDIENNYSSDGQFFPFNTGETVFEESNGQLTAKNVLAKSDTMKHWFGLTMTSRFVQMDGGRTDSGDAVTYEFSGDDDVWIFIDNVLVGDLGGIHSAASIKIDFSTGEIMINGESDGTLKEKFEAAGVSTEGWNNNTFPDDSLHTLRFYYLERGSADSNMSLKFNLVTVPESNIVKVDQEGNPVEGAEFELYTADENYTITGDPISSGITDSSGKIVLVDKHDALISFDELHRDGHNYFVLKEVKVPEGYRKTEEMHLRYIASESTGNIGRGIVVSDNYIETGAFANAKVSTTVSADINGINGETVPVSDGKLERGTLFAVILHRKPGEALENAASWYGISGNVLKEWTTSQGNGENLDGILETARKNPLEFYLNSSGMYQVDIPELPGDIQYYYSMLADDKKKDTQFAIGYYYTSADSVADATKGNTFRLDNTGFSSQYAANFNIPNIKNRLLVQKLDQEGSPITGAGFILYHSDDITVNADGSYEVNAGAQGMEVTTRDLVKESDGITMQGAAVYEGLSNGTYYLLESSAPEGYLLNEAVTKVVVDDSGVYADAGDADDGIVTARGVGSLVQTMHQFATNDDLDSTLYNIKAALQTQETEDFDSSAGWSPADNALMHLKYNADAAILEYTAEEDGGKVQLSTDTGWSRLNIQQCREHDNTTDASIKQDLGTAELAQLFSGTVTVQVTDIRSADLKISKTVKGYQGISAEDLSSIRNLKFTFNVSLLEEYQEDGAAKTRPLEGTYQIVDKNGDPVKNSDGTEVKAENGQAEFTLKDGESVTIKGLPEGAKYQITEQSAGNGFTAEIKSNDKEANVTVSRTVSGEIKDLDVSISGLEEITAEFVNTYTPAEATVEGSEFPGTKTLTGRSWDDTDSYTFEITAVTPQAPMPADTTVTVSKTDLSDPGDKVSFAFGTITYTKPGTYIYNIKEQLPSEIQPGVSYSQASYQVTVVVTDKDSAGAFTGQLEASVSIVKEKNDTGAAENAPADAVDFTNTYNRDAANFVLLAQKNYTDYGNNPLTENMFSFILSAKEGSRTDGSSVAENDIPMPDGTSGGVFKSGNSSTGEVSLGTLHFDQSDVGNTYVYQVYEKQPTDTGAYEGTGLEGAWKDPEKENAWVYKGITYDKEIKEITVTVTKDTNNRIVVTAEYENPGDLKLYFENSYIPESVTLSGNTALRGEKTLTGRDMLTGEAFEFELTAGNDAAESVLTSAETKKAENGKDGIPVSFSFGDLTFTKEDTYVFYMKEKLPDGVSTANPVKEGTVYDTHTTEVTVRVTDDKKGSLKAAVSYKNADGSSVTDRAVFNNSYKASGSYEIKGIKEIEGRTFLGNDSFTFKVEAQNNAPLPSNVKADGTITVSPKSGTEISIGFGTVSFDKAGQSYTYILSEVEPAENEKPGGLLYSKDKYQITITAKEGDTLGTLATEAVIIKNPGAQDEEETTEIKWLNQYTASGTLDGAVNLKGTKVLSGRDWTDDDLFTFRLQGGNTMTQTAISKREIILPAVTEKTVNSADLKDGKAAFSFDDITFTKATAPGSPYVFQITENLPAGVSENQPKKDGLTYDTHKYLISVTVTDNGDGTLTVVPRTLSGSSEFTNRYTSVMPEAETAKTEIVFTKMLTGRDWTDTDAFDFTITALEDAPLPKDADGNEISLVTVKKPSASNTASAGFGKINYTYDMISGEADHKKTFVYEIAEVIPGDSQKKTGINYDSSIYRVEITVEDNLKGTMTASLAVKQKKSDGTYAEVNAVGFHNTYKALSDTLTPLKITKILSGGREEDLKENEFKFELSITALDGSPENGFQLPDKTVIGNDADGAVQFGDIVFTEEGTYRVTVSEIKPDTGVSEGVTYDDNVLTYDVTVKDNEGNLEAEISNVTGSQTFTNKYQASGTLNGAANLKVTKELTGRDWLESDSFVFELLPADENTVNAVKNKTVVLPADTKLQINGTDQTKEKAFGDITFTKAGTYTFQITEEKGSLAGITYDTIPRTVTVKVTDNNDGTLTAAVISTGTHPFTWTNTYKTTGTAKYEIKGTKVLSGRQWKDNDEFSFRLAAGDDATEAAVTDGSISMPADTTVSATKEAQDFSFGNITFHKPGEYTFRVSEIKSTLGGITSDSHEAVIKIKVTDNYDGTMGAAGTEAVENSLTFRNTYEAAPTASEELTAEKILTGRDMKEGEFSFSVTPQDNAPAPTKVSVENTAAKENEACELNFGRITFTKAGTYTYLVKEEKGSLGGITYDEREYVVTYTVTDNLNGGFDIVSAITLDGKKADKAEFTNIYTAKPAEISGSTHLSGIKTVESEDPNASYTMKGGEFEFAITALTADAPLPEKSVVKNDAGGRFAFGNITYTAAGTYRYQISEVKGSAAGMSYDGSTYEVVVEVTDNGSGQLLADVSKNKELNFLNVYNPEEISASVSGTKSLTGRDMKEKEFSFSLEAGDDKTKEAIKSGAAAFRDNQEKLTVSNTEAGSVNFGQDAVTFYKTGDYTFRVTEEKGTDANITYDETVYEVKAKVTDENGVLKAEWTGTENIHFENKYAPFETEVSFNGTKTLDGREIKDGEFKFRVTDAEGNEVSSGSNDAEGNIEFTPIEFTEAGEYYYDISEVNNAVGGVIYDTNLYHVKVVIEDADGQLTASSVVYTTDSGESENGVIFKNVYRAENTSVVLGAVKELEGRKLEDGEFTFVLKDENGKTAAEAHNDADGMILFKELSFEKAGTYQYTVSEVKGTDTDITYDETVYAITVTVEDNQEGYLTAVVDDHGKDLVFRNQYNKPQKEDPKEDDPAADQPEEPEQTTTVKTGDEANIAGFTAAAIIALGAAAVTIALRRRKTR